MPLKALFFLVLSTFAFAIENPSKVEWLTPETHEFGDLIHKEAAAHEFLFRNISEDTISIDNVRPSCGCTLPNWEDSPVPPDSTGVIRVEYDANDQGYFKKKIKVYFSGQRKAEILYLEGWVVKLD